MQLKITLGSVAAFFLVFTACDNFVSEDSSALKDTLNISAPIEAAIPAVASYYADTLRCQDCEGVYTQIQFNNDSTFFMTELHAGKEKTPVAHAGRWTQNFDEVTIFPGGDRNMKFRLIPHALRVLSRDGKDLDSVKIAEVEKGRFNPRQPFTISGFYQLTTEASNFVICNYGKKFLVKKGLESEVADKMFNEKSNSDNSPILIEADITIEKVPDKNGNDQLQVILHKVKGKLETCLN